MNKYIVNIFRFRALQKTARDVGKDYDRIKAASAALDKADEIVRATRGGSIFMYIYVVLKLNEFF